MRNYRRSSSQTRLRGERSVTRQEIGCTQTGTIIGQSDGGGQTPIQAREDMSIVSSKTSESLHKAIIVTERLGKDANVFMPSCAYGAYRQLYSYSLNARDHDRILIGSRSFDRTEVNQRTVSGQRKLTLIFQISLTAELITHGWECRSTGRSFR